MPESLFDFPGYVPGIGLSNGHLQTLVPHLLRRVSVPFERSRLELDDGDFLLLDTLKQENESAPWVVLTHGLEGSSREQFVQGMARLFYDAGWNVQAWNFRSCGGELNRLPRFYHSGATEDLKQVISHVINQHSADTVFLVGCSMGGNQTLLTLADDELPAEVIGAATFSVPLDLESCAEKLAKPAQGVYMRRFIKNLKPKIQEKSRQFPKLVSMTGFDEIRTFHQFDERYTAPLHGFSSARDYWKKSSSKAVLAKLKKPALVVNAKDDPFLTNRCFDCCIRERSGNYFMETPSFGGHVGFARWQLNKPLWSENRALSFAYQLMEHRR